MQCCQPLRRRASPHLPLCRFAATYQPVVRGHVAKHHVRIQIQTSANPVGSRYQNYQCMLSALKPCHPQTSKKRKEYFTLLIHFQLNNFTVVTCTTYDQKFFPWVDLLSCAGAPQTLKHHSVHRTGGLACTLLSNSCNLQLGSCHAPFRPRLPCSYLAKSRPQRGCLPVTSSPPDSAITR